MSGYKFHLIFTQVISISLIFYLISIQKILFNYNLITLFSFSLLYSLISDIDIKSHIQKVIFIMLFAMFFILIIVFYITNSFLYLFLSLFLILIFITIKLLKHRKFTHSLIFGIIISIPFYFFFDFFYFIIIFISFLIHLIIDNKIRIY